MSEETVAIVRRNYEVMNALERTGDGFIDLEELAPDLWAHLAPDIEFHSRTDVPDVTVYRGRDGAKEFWRKLQEVWAELRWEPREFIDLGHAVVVETKLVARGRGSDIRLEADETDVFWFRDEAIVRLQAFPTKAEALEAARSAG